MNTRVVRFPIRSGWAFLLIIPISSLAAAATLREEAVSYRAQGYEAQQRGDQANAFAFYQKAAALDPTYPAPFNDIGVLLEAQGRFEEAERAYQKALALNPDYLEAHSNLALVSERLGKREQAIEHWLKRYQLGEIQDPWTARAEERLVALGIMAEYPGLKGTPYLRRHETEKAFASQAESLKEFHDITDAHGD